MSSLYLIDYYASSNTSFLHRFHVLAKLIFYFTVLLLMVFSSSFYWLSFFISLILILVLLSHVPLSQVIKWAFFPSFFALIFALSQLGAGLLPYLTMLRAVGAALLSIFFFTTTPYPTVFSLIAKISPSLAAFFLFSYRFFFMLLDSFTRKVRIIRLRGGFRGLKIFSHLSKLTGYFFVELTTRAEKIYRIMELRGFRGSIPVTSFQRFRLRDFLLVAATFFLTGVWLWL